MNKKDDACYCEQCKHQKAIQCIDEFLCKCCEKDDRIRFEHPVFDPEEELTKEEKARREQVAQEEKNAERKASAIGDDSLYSFSS